MSFFGELTCLQVWETSLSFSHGFSSHLQPKFPNGSPPPTTTIPGDSRRIREILPAGLLLETKKCVSNSDFSRKITECLNLLGWGNALHVY